MSKYIPDQYVGPRPEAGLVRRDRDAGKGQAFGVVADSHPIAHAAVAACREGAGAAAGRHVACLALEGRVNMEDKSG